MRYYPMLKREGEEMRFRDNKQLTLNHVVNKLQTTDTLWNEIEGWKEVIF